MCSVLSENPDRFALLPVERDSVFAMYKRHQSTYWTPSEIDFSHDRSDYEKLSDEERSFLRGVLSFFAISDGLVVENLVENFSSEVQWMEARAFYSFQAMIEVVHAETYGLQIEGLGLDVKELSQVVHSDGAIKAKADWARKWFDGSLPLAERLLAMMCFEGINFSASFASIFYFKKTRAGKMPGLTFSNELISRDESLHCLFACLLLKEGGLPRVSESRAHSIVRESVDVEKQFVRESLQVGLIGMSSDQMCEYVEFISNYYLRELGYTPLYPDASNPFEFMELISLQGKSNFFERRVGEYAMSSVSASEEIKFNEEF